MPNSNQMSFEFKEKASINSQKEESISGFFPKNNIGTIISLNDKIEQKQKTHDSRIYGKIISRINHLID